MKKYSLPSLFFTLLLCTVSWSQSVAVVPKKTVYTRPKPTQNFKRTFVVTYPKVRAATPALSRKIENALSYSKVLGLNLREELAESQWLEEASYNVDYNQRGILIVTLSMNGTAAYPDGTSKTVAIDLRTGDPITAARAFGKRDELVRRILEKQKKEVDDAIAEMRKDPETKDMDPEELFGEKKFTEESLEQFSIDDTGVTFIYEYDFPHVIEALEPEGRYKFSWKEVAPFINVSGPLAQFLGK